MSNLQYIGNILFGFVGYFIMLFILFNLWQYLYSDPKELINGYNMSQMVWYVIITEILWMTIGGRKLCKKISNDVKSGNVTYNINKPYNYVGYSLFQHLGDIFVKGIIYFILGMLVGLLFLHKFPVISPFGFIIVILTCVLALIISALILTSIGLIAFFIEDSNPLYWIYSKFILVLGTIFPIEYFPSFLQKILVFSPVYVVSYGPAKLFVDFSLEKAVSIILAQSIYIVIAYSVCLFIYKKGVRKINVNGG
jgi:ABC-2 type transport system permease protein